MTFHGLAASAASWLAITNGFLGVTNLAPIAPLDGGRVLTALLWRASDDAEQARLTSARAGLVAGTATVVIATAVFLFTERLGAWLFVFTLLTGAFIAHAAWREVIGAVVRGRLTSQQLSAVMTPQPRSVPSDLSVEHYLRVALSGPQIGHPVVRWGVDPIGYVSPLGVMGLDDPERSWTTVADLMVPVDRVQRAWATETVADFLERSGAGAVKPATVIVVHDPVDGRPVGTLVPSQLDPLFASPNVWGVTNPGPPPPKVTIPSWPQQ